MLRAAATAARAGGRRQQQQFRAAAAPRRALHQNKHVEEWNGLREITEKSFEFDSANTSRLLLAVGLFPAIFYYLVTADRDARDFEPDLVWGKNGPKLKGSEIDARKKKAVSDEADD